MCPRHMGMKFPSRMMFCTFSDCAVRCSGRPESFMRVPDRVEIPPPPPVKIYVRVRPRPRSVAKKCAWHRCEHVARLNRKYCSKACSNRNARRCYRERKKLERKDDK